MRPRQRLLFSPTVRSLLKQNALLGLLLSAHFATLAGPTVNTMDAGRTGSEDQSLHCGNREANRPEPEKVSPPNPGNQDTAASVDPPKNPDGQTLELVLHFPDKQGEIPAECIGRLLKLSEQVKSGQKGRLTIRSRNSADASSEMDLALASERLELIKNFFRNDRLALRAMRLELKPDGAYIDPRSAKERAQRIEIYSNPVN